MIERDVRHRAAQRALGNGSRIRKVNAVACLWLVAGVFVQGCSTAHLEDPNHTWFPLTNAVYGPSSKSSNASSTSTSICAGNPNDASAPEALFCGVGGIVVLAGAIPLYIAGLVVVPTLDIAFMPVHAAGHLIGHARDHYEDRRAASRAKKRENELLAMKPADLSIAALAFSDPLGQEALVAGEQGTIRFTVKNAQGAGLASGLTARVRAGLAAAHLKFPRDLDIGELAPGESRDVAVPIDADFGLEEGKAVFDIRFKETRDNPPRAIRMEIATRKLRPPIFSVGQISVDDGIYKDPARLAFGNGNGILEPGESAELYVTLANGGAGEARTVRVSLEGADGRDIRLLERGQFKTEHELDVMPPGSWRRLAFAVSVSRLYSGPRRLPLRLKITERRERFDTEIPLNIEIGKAPPQPLIVSVDPSPVSGAAGSLPTFGAELYRLPGYKTPPRRRAFAVVIGIDKYRDVQPVPYAASDAKLVGSYMVRALGIPESNVKILLDERATWSDIENALGVWLRDQIASQGGPGAEVFVYYSGHGTPNPATGAAFLAPYDVSPDALDTDGYPLERLYAALAALHVKGALVVLDSCFSGAGGPRTLIAKGTRPLLTVQQGPPVAGRVTVLAASTGAQVSGNFEEKQHGLLTYYFLHGLQGRASRTGGKAITLKGLFDYLRPEVVKQARSHNREQEPQLLPRNGLGVWAEEPLAVLK